MRAVAVADALRGLVAAVLVLGCAAGAATGDDAFLAGQRYYEAGRYAEAVEALERARNAHPLDSERHRWFGMAIGRLAEEGAWLLAPGRVGQARVAFERAVELDADNVSALRALARFYREAPMLLGGDEDKARAVENRIEEIESRDQAGSTPKASR